MKTNQGRVERALRIAAGAAMLAWGYFTGGGASFLAIALMVMGIILAATGLIAYCPIWHVLGVSTRQGSKKIN